MSVSLQAKDVVKHFGAVKALVDGQLSVAQGEIHALMGANGCGKSTLCKIIAGAVAPTSGEIVFAGEAVQFSSPREAESKGIALFYQELSLIPQLSVADNIFLGHEPRKAGFVDRKALGTGARNLLKLFEGVSGDGLEPGTIVGDLPPDQRQIVEILKVFAKQPRLMIMDEATAALDGRQSERFFEILREKKAQGVSTIMISHRLDEVFAVCDRVTVMRNGATINTNDTAATTRDDVVRDMIGDVHAPAPRNRMIGPDAEIVLGLKSASNFRVSSVSLSARKGEILGLAGLQGQGQSALLQGIFGARPFTEGEVAFNGKPLTIKRPGQAVRQGIAYVSGDRGRDAALGGRSIFENLVSALTVRERLKIVDPTKLKPRVEETTKNLKTKFSSLDAPIGTLSGGNQQKIFISRWLATRPKLLLLDDPTKGIDLGAKSDLFVLMRKLADEGATILFYSSEDSEVLDYADRVIVFNGGKVSAELEGDAINAVNLARAAFGEAA